MGYLSQGLRSAWRPFALMMNWILRDCAPVAGKTRTRYTASILYHPYSDGTGHCCFEEIPLWNVDEQTRKIKENILYAKI